jgi:hypothetical protein
MAGLKVDLEVVGDAVASLLKDQKKQILEHVGRMIKLSEAKAKTGGNDEILLRNLHRRVTAIESELRRRSREGER